MGNCIEEYFVRAVLFEPVMRPLSYMDSANGHANKGVGGREVGSTEKLLVSEVMLLASSLGSFNVG